MDLSISLGEVLCAIALMFGALGIAGLASFIIGGLAKGFSR